MEERPGVLITIERLAVISGQRGSRRVRVSTDTERIFSNKQTLVHEWNSIRIIINKFTIIAASVRDSGGQECSQFLSTHELSREAAVHASNSARTERRGLSGRR